MKLNYSLSSQDFAITPAITEAAESVVTKLKSQYAIHRTDIACRKTPEGFHVSITAKPEHGASFHSEAANEDLYKALNQSKAKVIRQLKDRKEKMKGFDRTTVSEALLVESA